MTSDVQVRQILKPRVGIPLTEDTSSVNQQTVTSNGSTPVLSTWTFNQMEAGTRPEDYTTRVTVDGDKTVYINFGTAPVASSSNGWMCPPGVYNLPVVAFGHKFSIVEK